MAVGGAHPGYVASSRLTTLLLCVVLAGCAAMGQPVQTSGGPPVPLPHFDHVLVVVEENHSYGQIIGSPAAPYLNALAERGAVFTDAHGVTHPSQPNYLALFAGSTFGLTSDACPQDLSGSNLASELLAHGRNFTAYSEDLPQAGYSGCSAGDTGSAPLYARKHAPWADFANVPADNHQPFSSFSVEFSRLPTVAFVVPNQLDDMHSGSVAAGDDWLRQHIGAYAQWATSHNSLLIVTWDEDEGSSANHILTLFAGAHIHPGQYAETIDHYSVLRTIEALFGVPYSNGAARASTIADVWQA